MIFEHFSHVFGTSGQTRNVMYGASNLCILGPEHVSWEGGPIGVRTVVARWAMPPRQC